MGEIAQAVAVVGVTLAVSYALARVGIDIDEFGAPGPASFGLGAVTVEIIYLGPRVFYAWVQVQFTHYLLTTDRIYARTEFFSTDLKVVPYEKITLLTVRRGLLGRLLGFAELAVTAYGTQEGRVRMRGLREPGPLFDLARRGIRVHNTAEAIARSD